MKKYSNGMVLKLIGNQLQQIRASKELDIEDVAYMTGFQTNTIRKIENGEETSLSYFAEICFALEIHPSKALFDLPFELKPRFPLSSTRKEKSRITARIQILIKNGFFNQSKTTNEVADELKGRYEIKISTKALSSILGRMEKAGLLKSILTKRRKVYTKL